MTPAQAEKEYAAAERAGLAYVTRSDPSYPEALAATDDASPLLAPAMPR